jgi:hypothetical protein
MPPPLTNKNIIPELSVNRKLLNIPIYFEFLIAERLGVGNFNHIKFKVGCPMAIVASVCQNTKPFIEESRDQQYIYNQPHYSYVSIF